MGSPALAALFDSRRGGRPVVSLTFLALCVVVTVASLLFPSLERLLGGIGERRHLWQPFTAVLEHGWPGFPALLHLALNAFLILECGRPCERLLGSGRFLVLCLASAAANAALQVLTEGVNGSSLVIWAWGPPLLVALLWARRRGRGEGDGARTRIRGVLIVMYVVVTAFMSLLPYASGWRGDPLRAFLLGNRYHLTATAAGVLGALLWRHRIDARLRALAEAVG